MRGIIFGVANPQSIAAGCARALAKQGHELTLTCQHEKAMQYAQPVADETGARLMPCDVTIPGQATAVFTDTGDVDFVIHSMAFAPRDALRVPSHRVLSAEFAQTMDVSVRSFLTISSLARLYMPGGGTILTLSYLGAERAVQGYGVMGVAKAALESAVRYTAADLGPFGVRVNAISAGVLSTRAAKGIPAFQALQEKQEDAPLNNVLTADAVGDMAAALIGPAGRCVTGEVIHVDNGAHAMG